jgi:Mg/Co/Ni transporter MgtE
MIRLNSYINYDIEPLTPQNSIAEVMIQFAGMTCTHLPVVENDFLIGNISEDDIQAFDSSRNVGDYRYALDTFFVKKTTNWLDVLGTFAQNNANLMPVLDDANEYIGYYELMDIITIFNDTPFLYEPGGIVIIEKGLKDYSFSEISQIVESNEGKLLGAFISDTRDDIVQITLKVGNTGLNAILQSLRRYNYNIVLGNEDDVYMEGLKERSDYLKKFLNI